MNATEIFAHAGIVIPAFDAEPSLAGVIGELRAAIPELHDAMVVVDDGSSDATAKIARNLGCEALVHPRNRGKGAALLSGLQHAATCGWRSLLTVDADGQHPATAAREVLLASRDPEAFVLGVRDLARDGAPKKNQMSNAISNYFLSRFAGTPLRDTQCGLRRYPVARTLALETRGRGYDFEAEILLKAVWAGVEIVEQPIVVRYPPDRRTHFHVARDPWRILRTVLSARIGRGRSFETEGAST